MMNFFKNEIGESDIAIIAMSGRFPGAKNIDAFWENLRFGVESVSWFSDEELLMNGVHPEPLQNPNYVKAKAVLDDIELFDANFFGFNPKDAEILDPQQRLFLECAWETLEQAGYNPQTYAGSIGVYAGAGLSDYLLKNLYLNPAVSKTVSAYQLTLATENDYLPTRVAYKLNLTGPAVNIQTACSTSLVAVHMACQSLLNGECDMALAGAVTVSVPQKEGYLYLEGMILSPDGHCRAFDAKAQGTIGGDGVGIVMLKRATDARRDGDYIHAIIKGSAINNDGTNKIGFTAPSVEGQAAVIGEAQAIAGIDATSISYIEAHGTATELGDPIEIAALTKAFHNSTQKKHFCAIGSVKTNIGHLDTAAGVAGLIKTVLALKHKQIPPSLHYQTPNPKIDFANSPFYVNTKLSEWKTNGIPRRAGVSSFGIGGTNAHVVLEEAPVLEKKIADKEEQTRPVQLLILSAKTSKALEAATLNLTEHLKRHPEIDLADVAYTLSVGRQAFEHRRILVCSELDEAITTLPEQVLTGYTKSSIPSVIFMFSGQGSQYVNMAREIYQNEAVFRQQVDYCAELLLPELGLDLRHILYPDSDQTDEAAQQLQQTAIAQPALFTIEYALAKLWESWGIQPQGFIGHSIGEYVAACLAGVFSLEDALCLVAARGRMMQQLPPGAMLSVPLAPEALEGLLGVELSIAAINEPSRCVVSGPMEAVANLLHQLGSQGIECIRLRTSHAFHSQMMEPILEPFAKLVQKVTLHSPQIPYISNVTGTWITAEQARDPHYWSQHLRSPVQFARGIERCLKTADSILLEVGPGRTLSTLTKHHPSKEANQIVLTSLRHPQEVRSDMAFLFTTLGQLWLGGVKVNWSGFYANEQRYRVPLPTYPFERQRYWVESPQTNNREHLQQNLTAPPIWNSVVEAGRIQASSEILKLTNSTEQAKRECLDSLSIAYMLKALRGIGAFSNPGENYSVEKFFARFQIQPRYHQLVSQWLSLLVKQGYLQQDGDQFIKLVRLTEDISTLVEEAKVKWASQPEELNLLMRCGDNLVAVLTGQEEPLGFFFREGSFNVYENTIEESVSIPYYNGIWQACLQQIVNSLPPDRQLRILEIGAGSGITTRALLPILSPSQTSYTFTDIGSAFLGRAKQRFSAYPFVEYRLLNIEQPPQEQGYDLHKFDMVIATNVLHVTRNMGETLKHVRSLLAPGGILLIQEITKEELDFYVTFGLLMQSLSDGERNQANPFLSTQQWHEALNKQGFAEVAIFPETHDLVEHIIVGRATPSGLFPRAFTELVEPKAAMPAAGEAIAPLDEVSLSKKPDIADWFYIPSWKRGLLPTQTRQVKSSWLFFVDECGLGDQLVKKLKQAGEDVIVVREGEQFSKYDMSLYILNPRQRDHYDILLKELSTSDKIPTHIVHLWSVTENSSIESRLEWVELTQDLGFYSLMFLAQALGKQNLTDDLRLTVVSNGIQEVIGEELLYPEKATTLGLIRTIPQEYPNITPLSIDVVLPRAGSESEQKLITHLLNELQTTSSERIIAYRGNHRWVQTFEPVRLDKSEQELQRLREEGVYLITGGLGGIGLVLAEYLAHTVRAKLILTGRSAFPDRSEWEKWLNSHDDRDQVSQKIRKLQELEKLGAEVLVVSADVANLSQMQGAIDKVLECFGKINGVIHSVVADSGNGVIQRKTREMAESTFAPKVKGTLVLDSILKDIQLDWFVLCSSIVSIVGDFGLVDYCAANAFLDSFAHYKSNRDSTFTVSINWGAWQEEGQAVEVAKRLASGTKFSTTQLTEETASFSDLSFGTTTPKPLFHPHLKYGLLPAEGVEVFHRILCNSIPHVIVSTQDLEIAIKQANSIPHVIVSTQDLEIAIKQNKGETRLNERQDLEKSVRFHSRSPRPVLTNAYVAYRNELERTIAQIWQDFLGIEPIGIYDDFFDLGGDSLLGIQLTSKLSETLQEKISPNRLLNTPTIAALAEFLEMTNSSSSLAKEKNGLKRSSLLVELHKGSSQKQPFFLIHPIGGSVYNYRYLAQNLGADQPVYGIQARGLDGEGEPLTQVEEMAKSYLDLLQTVQPVGPYQIGGWSLGGLVAFEIAQQIRQQGQEASQLVMINSFAPIDAGNSSKTDEASLLALFARYTGEIVGKEFSVSVAELKQLNPEEQLQHILVRGKKLGVLPPGIRSEQMRHRFEVFRANSQASKRYTPQPYPGRITFFCADESMKQNQDPSLGWAAVAAGSIITHNIPGNHYSIIGSEILAQKLRYYLN